MKKLACVLLLGFLFVDCGGNDDRIMVTEEDGPYCMGSIDEGYWDLTFIKKVGLVEENEPCYAVASAQLTFQDNQPEGVRCDDNCTCFSNLLDEYDEACYRYMGWSCVSRTHNTTISCHITYFEKNYAEGTCDVILTDWQTNKTKFACQYRLIMGHIDG